MSRKSEQLQKVWHRYEKQQNHRPTSAREAVEWAVGEGLIELPSIDPYDILAGEMAHALREEFDTDATGRRYRVNHAVRVSKAGVHEQSGVIVGDIWDDIQHIRAAKKEALGYPTQKPQELLERIVKASSNEGDLVLDPFCGCGTAIAAAKSWGASGLVSTSPIFQ